MGAGLPSAPAAVEDVKNSITKMFSTKNSTALNTKAPAINFPSIFKKK